MGWRTWMRFQSEGDRRRFEALKAVLFSRLPKETSFTSLAHETLLLAVARLAASCRDGTDEAVDVAERAEKLAADDPGMAALVAAARRLQYESPYPSDPAAYPAAPDMAAPFLDAFAPADWRRGRGFYITPPPLAAQLVEALGVEADEASAVRLFEPGCGSGMLALAVLGRCRHALPSQKNRRAARLGELLSGWRIVEREPLLAAIVSAQLLTLLAEESRDWLESLSHWPIVTADVFATKPGAAFSHAIANPPFVGEKRARAAIAAARQAAPQTSRAYAGKADYWFLFLQTALDALRPGGRLAFLTPAYWPTADGAHALRQTIAEQTQRTNLFEPCETIPAAKGLATLVFSATKWKIRLIAEQQSSEIFHVREDSEETALLNCMAAAGRMLAGADGPFTVDCGVQTGADRATAAQAERLPRGAPIGAGIFVLSDAEREALLDRCEARERKLIVPLSKTPAIGPYVLAGKPAGWLIYLDGSIDLDTLPALRNHLKPFKAVLSARRECRLGRMPWWRLHWPRRAALFATATILAPQRAACPRFALAPQGRHTSVDVYHLAPRALEPLTLFGWLALLHSAPVHFWLARRGKRKGALLELYATPLQRLPAPRRIAPASVRRLDQIGAALHAEMKTLAEADEEKPWHLAWAAMRRSATKKAGELLALQEEADALVARAYGLTRPQLQRLRQRLKRETDRPA